MDYIMSLIGVFMMWWLAFFAAGWVLRVFHLDWGDMATTLDTSRRRKAGMFVLGKHVLLVGVMLSGISFLANSYPGHETLTFILGIVWALALFPAGLVALPIILIFWLG